MAALLICSRVLEINLTARCNSGTNGVHDGCSRRCDRRFTNISLHKATYQQPGPSQTVDGQHRVGRPQLDISPRYPPSAITRTRSSCAASAYCSCRRCRCRACRPARPCWTCCRRTLTKWCCSRASRRSWSSSRRGAGTAGTWCRCTRSWPRRSPSRPTRSRSPRSTPTPTRPSAAASASRASRRSSGSTARATRPSPTKAAGTSRA